MSWNNRIFKRDYDGQTLYEIHETFYNSGGKICAWTDKPEFGPAETIDELIDWINMIYHDAVKYRDDILDYDCNEFAAWDYEEDDETDSD